jgi:hypothetical protein
MKTLKNLFAAVTLVAVLTFGTTFASAGLLISDLTGGNGADPCKEGAASVTGVIITGFTGVIITGFTGVIITGAADDCGVIITG